jgi:hypothetical protein|tara:strand:- start:106 stop:348 length:243 start_codon:yes stop_codon:yes gene_type:complete
MNIEEFKPLLRSQPEIIQVDPICKLEMGATKQGSASIFVLKDITVKNDDPVVVGEKTMALLKVFESALQEHNRIIKENPQ